MLASTCVALALTLSATLGLQSAPDTTPERAHRAHVVVFENTSHYLFRDREADVLREMTAFYHRIKK